MPQKKTTRSSSQYYLDEEGNFIIRDYNHSKTFSNFFPGIAGIWGIPMWVFYVNRGQGISSFGVESKNKAILEFQPANKAYRLTSLQGFRTFIKLWTGTKSFYWEPFQQHLQGTQYRKTQIMTISDHELNLEEENKDLGLRIRVNFFTLPEEPFAALVRWVTIENLTQKTYHAELIDGLPLILPYGINDGLVKNLSRTIEAWYRVDNLKKKAPYYHLNVEIADTAVVTHIKQGNFYFGFNPEAKTNKLFPPLVESSLIFGEAHDFSAPERFLNSRSPVLTGQQTTNRTPSAMCFAETKLKAHQSFHCVSLTGNIHSQDILNQNIPRLTKSSYITQKRLRNKQIIDDVRNFVKTKSSSTAFDCYVGHTFLDNVLRGGLPISMETKYGPVGFNVFSRKHGDLERDYNFFVVAPTYYSQGNGNYRDVNQNRRNDVWFNKDIQDHHITNFMNLIQADGYNPLIVKGASFFIEDKAKLEEYLHKFFNKQDQDKVGKLIKKGFQPGALLSFILEHDISLKISFQEFLTKVLELCRKQEMAEHGEGFWTDHWTYNLDLIESYLSIYPEKLQSLLLEKKVFTFYHNLHYVLARKDRYVLTPRGIRQYHTVAQEKHDAHHKSGDHRLRIKEGEGEVYHTHLSCKLLCLLANKIASLDPSGVGVEMEADKPNWYDALNGLPGLLGSSVSETIEIKRLAKFFLDAVLCLNLSDQATIPIFEELASFLTGLVHLLSTEKDPHSFWQKANDLKEHYRHRTRFGIVGQEIPLSIFHIKEFLRLVIARTDTAIILAKDKEGFLSTYFYHEVTDYQLSEKHSKETKATVHPLKFRRHSLPPFLEGYVHAMRVAENPRQARELYKKVRQSDLYDKKLKMYKVNADLSSCTEEIGRTRIFPPGWLENESIWLHMEYKFLLEVLRSGLYEEFYEDFRHALIPFLNPQQYGRNIIENSSFLVSSAHEDAALHGQGFVARLSGSTAEFLHMWLLMNVGKQPFQLDAQGKLVLKFQPALPGRLFTNKESVFFDPVSKQSYQLPGDIYAFIFLGHILVVYHNPKRHNTFEEKKVKIRKIDITYPNQKAPYSLQSGAIPEPYSRDIRDRKVQRLDIYFA